MQVDYDLISHLGTGIGAPDMPSPHSRYTAYSPSPSASPHVSGLRSSSSPSLSDQEKFISELLALAENDFQTCVDFLDCVLVEGRYLSELLAEHKHFSPFASVLPNCARLLNQEILRVTALLKNASILDQSGLEHANPMAFGGVFSNGGANLNGWASRFQSEMFSSAHPSLAENWPISRGGSSGLIVKKKVRLDIPVDQHPYYNFVGRLLGPRGNSLKRVEASTGCRVLIRGRGSIKDPEKEEIMRGKPGYEHLNEPLHILVEAELPVDIIDARLIQACDILQDLLKPVDESQDVYKKQQLLELAMLNGTLREEGSPMSGSPSPFNYNLGMKRAKTQG